MEAWLVGPAVAQPAASMRRVSGSPDRLGEEPKVRQLPRERPKQPSRARSSRADVGTPLRVCHEVVCVRDDTESPREPPYEAPLPGAPEVELEREEVFTEREVAAAAGSLAQVARGGMQGCGSLAQGDLVQALHGSGSFTGIAEVYRAGDEGTVALCYKEPNTENEVVEVTWARTGLRSRETHPRHRLRFLRRQVLVVGDLMEALPGPGLSYPGLPEHWPHEEFTVSRFRRGDQNGPDLVEVTSARTGLASTVPRALWMEAFRFVRRQVLSVGDVLEALPGVELMDGDVDLYRPGDRGTVCCFYREEGTGHDRMEVEWWRTGRKSDESALWMRWFRLVPRATESWPLASPMAALGASVDTRLSL